MNGLRAVNKESLQKWHAHLPRIAAQLAVPPAIAQDLIRLGYEADEGWLQLLKGVEAKQFPCRYPERKPYLKDWERGPACLSQVHDAIYAKQRLTTDQAGTAFAVFVPVPCPEAHQIAAHTIHQVPRPNIQARAVAIKKMPVLLCFHAQVFCIQQ